MSRLGRGRVRGGRILDIPDLLPHFGYGRVVTGRGVPFNIVPRFNTHSIFEMKLSHYIRTGRTCIVAITLEYLAVTQDHQYFIDTVIDALLKSPRMITNFTRHFKLITLIKTHGKDIQKAAFVKLQIVFEELIILMQEDKLTEENKTALRNLSDLISQLYYRFRVDLDTLQRYSLFELPTIECMKYLLSMRSPQELKVLVGMIIQNYAALRENHSDEMAKLSLNVRSIIMLQDSDTTREALIWLLCALDYVSNNGAPLPAHVVRLYHEVLGYHWEDIAPKPLETMLAEIPQKIVEEQMDKFDVTFEYYKEHTSIKTEQA